MEPPFLPNEPIFNGARVSTKSGRIKMNQLKPDEVANTPTRRIKGKMKITIKSEASATLPGSTAMPPVFGTIARTSSADVVDYLRKNG